MAEHRNCEQFAGDEAPCWVYPVLTMSALAPDPYSTEQVAFLELYKLITDDSLPEAAQVDDLLSQGAADGIWTADGTTLLHVAAMYAKPAALVEQLCRAKPQQACIASKSLGYLPLHYGACNGAAPDVVTILFNAHPQGADTRDKKGLTPMALAQKMGCDPDA